MATLFIDYENGNDNWGGTSFSVLASGTDGRISTNTFSSATANFSNNGTLAPTKNLLGYSQNLNVDSYFVAARTVRSISTVSPPTGVPSSVVYSVLETGDSNTHDLRTTSNAVNLTLAQNYTTSCYVRANGRNQIVLRHGNNAAKGIRFNLSNGTVAASGASATGAISNEGNGWYRISLTTTPDAFNDLIYIMLAQDSYTGTTAETYEGDISKGFLITAPQLELNSSVTSYETPPSPQYLSIFNGSTYSAYYINRVISSTSLELLAIANGTALANQSVDRQYFIGGRYKTLTTGTSSARLNSGDIVRVMGSPDPTSIGNATWTSNIVQSTKNITSSTNASPININLSTHGYVTGDTVIITGHATNTNANGTWIITRVDNNNFTLNGSTGNGVGGSTGTARLRNNTVVTLASSVTQNVASCGNRGEGRTAWTQSSNITATLNTSDYKEGDCSDSIDVAAAFTTGLAAYKATGTLNLSGYQQLSFWIKQTAGTIGASGAISLALCSDTLGATPVNTFNIENLLVLNRWTPITINLATNLGTSIQSIALYVNTDNGAQTFLLSNIIACKASSSSDSLTLQSLIGKNISTDTFYAIQSINGSRVMLDQDPTATPVSTSLRGYCDGSVSSSTVNTFKRETIKTIMATTNTTQVQTMTRGGTSYADGSFTNVLYEGGWDRSSMSVQNLETWFDGRNGLGYGLYFTNTYWNSCNKISFVRYFQSIEALGGWGYSFSNGHFNNNSSIGFQWNSPTRVTMNNVFSNNNAANNINFTNPNLSSINNVVINNSSANGVNFWYGASNNLVSNINAHNNASYGIYFDAAVNNSIRNSFFNLNSVQGLRLQTGSGGNKFINCATSGNVSNGVGYYLANDNYFTNYIGAESSPFAITNYWSNNKIISQNHNNTANFHLITTEYGTIYSTVAVRYSNSGFAWALAPTNVFRDRFYPLDFKIATVAVNANSLVVIRAWVRRSNINLTMGLRIKANQIAGVSNDITSYMSAAADTWQQVTLTFTPTETGVVEILAECFGGTTYTGYIDDISITQV
jgi:hypothetical protein